MLWLALKEQCDIGVECVVGPFCDKPAVNALRKIMGGKMCLEINYIIVQLRIFIVGFHNLYGFSGSVMVFFGIGKKKDTGIPPDVRPLNPCQKMI